MKICLFLDNAARYLVDPSNTQHTSSGLAWAITVIAGIVTLGSAQGLSGLWRFLRKNEEENETHILIHQVFTNILGCGKFPENATSAKTSLQENLQEVQPPQNETALPILAEKKNLTPRPKEKEKKEIKEKKEPSEQEKQAAATLLQTYIRGHQTRGNFLPGLYDKATYRTYQWAYKNLEDTNKREDTPRATTGRVPVFFPKEASCVVVKEIPGVQKIGEAWFPVSGTIDRKAGLKRIYQMESVRSLLQTQKSSHLIVPKAMPFKDRVFEERLPINVDYFYNIGLYLSNLSAFDEAARELTRLFLQVHIGDLVVKYNKGGSCYWDSLGLGFYSRFDNFPLYILDDGKIGLIDLEQLEESFHPQGHQAVAFFFPSHLDIIKEEAKKQGIEKALVTVKKKDPAEGQELLKKWEEELDEAAERGKQLLFQAYSHHVETLEKSGDLLRPEKYQFKVSKGRKQELIQLFTEELLSLHELNKVNAEFKKQRNKWSEFLFKERAKEKVEEVIHTIAEPFLNRLLNRLTILITKNQGVVQVGKKTGLERTAYIVEQRTIEMTPEFLETDRDGLFSRYRQIFDPGLNYFHLGIIFEYIEHKVLENLAKKGELVFFRSLGPRSYCWLKY